ncbi:PREDICTED: uncharacterized protein LOC104733314 [Camelina sativa]|uniref:S-protein homolog n=1 Tax=Camelina sativa TaxID=90675 RepID=A0ABM0V5R3_CAMSA|nr:PREDICTED: uncharacterized protein LOC104733314 [Camelina sativa]
MCGSYTFNILFSVIFMVILFGCLCEARVHVNVDIINNIDPNVQLGLHCKSKHKDLGSQSLAPGKHWGFIEGINAWETTLFFCHFEWGSQSKWFDILVTKRDQYVCKRHSCVWSIRHDGPCRLTGREKCYHWRDNI